MPHPRESRRPVPAPVPSESAPSAAEAGPSLETLAPGRILKITGRGAKDLAGQLGLAPGEFTRVTDNRPAEQVLALSCGPMALEDEVEFGYAQVKGRLAPATGLELLDLGEFEFTHHAWTAITVPITEDGATREVPAADIRSDGPRDFTLRLPDSARIESYSSRSALVSRLQQVIAARRRAPAGAAPEAPAQAPATPVTVQAEPDQPPAPKPYIPGSFYQPRGKSKLGQ